MGVRSHDLFAVVWEAQDWALVFEGFLHVVLTVDCVQVVRAFVADPLLGFVAVGFAHWMLDVGVSVGGGAVEFVAGWEVDLLWAALIDCVRFYGFCWKLLFNEVVFVSRCAVEGLAGGTVIIFAFSGFQLDALGPKVGLILGVTLKGEITILILDPRFMFIPRPHRMPGIVLPIRRINVIVMPILWRSLITLESYPQDPASPIP